jgi:hypothetical protein
MIDNETKRLFVFQCSAETYLTCMEHSLFGSNKEWPLSVKRGDYCLLHHYDAGTILGLWQADGDGARNVVKQSWNGRFPYQVKVKLVSGKAIEVPKTLLGELGADPATGKFDERIVCEIASRIIQEMKQAK